MIRWWRLLRLRIAGQIPSLFEIHVDPFLRPYRGILHADYIGERQGPRPTIIGTAPQRQKDQKTSIKQYERVNNILINKARTYGRDLVFELSYLERLGGTYGLKARKQSHNAVPETLKGGAIKAWSTATKYTEHANRSIIKQFGYEIAHAHHADGSLHVILHPEDVRTVIEQGFGERHPIASTSWHWLFYYNTWKQYWWPKDGCRPPIPETLVFLYAPRSKEELDSVSTIVDAAIWFVTGDESGSVIGLGPSKKDRYDDEGDRGNDATVLEESSIREGRDEQRVAQEAITKRPAILDGPQIALDAAEDARAVAAEAAAIADAANGW